MAGKDFTNLKNALDSFSSCTEVPVTLYDPEGAILAEFLPLQKFCQFFPQYTTPGSECTDNTLFSITQSYEMGEPYIYYCPAGLIHIAVPVIENGKLLACAVAGPLVMGETDERLLDQAISLNGTPVKELSRIAMFTSQMRHFLPTQIQKLSSLLYSSVLLSQQNFADYAHAVSRHRQQLAMGEQIQARKRSLPSGSVSLSCAELESMLIDAFRIRDLDAALDCQERLLDQLILVEGGNFDSIKMHLIELFLTASRIATESGVPLRKALGENMNLLGSLIGVESVEALSEWSRRTAAFFVNEVLAGLSPLSSTTSKAIAYLNEHYMDKITLRELASKLFVSDSYLSKLFRQELGTSFTDYLNKSRVEHSIDLMQSTELSLLEISGMVGFEDQSYFTKVFKRITGETPRQYKTHLLNGKGGEEA